MNTMNIHKSWLLYDFIVPILFFGFMNNTGVVKEIRTSYGNQILVSNSWWMNHSVYEEYEELNTVDHIEGEFTFESALSQAKSSLNKYFSSLEYRTKLENEVKIEKYAWNDLELSNFEEKITWIVLSPEDYIRIDAIISDRKNKLETIDIVPVSQIAFHEKWKFMEDLEWSVSWFYYASEIAWWEHYMGIKKNKSDKKFSFPEFGKVYVLDLFSLWSGFWTKEAKHKQMISVLFHELWGHGVMNYDKGFTKWSERVYKIMTKKWENTDFATYFGDKSEVQSRMMEFRQMLFLLGKIPAISSPIEETHIAILISHYEKNGDDVSVMLLKKYEPLELKNIMNWITMNEKLDVLDTRVW